jgi:hypothetical protein
VCVLLGGRGREGGRGRGVISVQKGGEEAGLPLNLALVYVPKQLLHH